MSAISRAFRRFVLTVKTAARHWLSDRAPSMGAAIAYYTVFSMIPMLVVVISVAALAYGRNSAEGALFSELSGVIGAESAKAIEAILRSAGNTKSGIVASVIGIGTILVSATAVFGELQSALNIIWKVKVPRELGVWYFVKSRLLSLSVVFGAGLLLVASLIVGAAVTAFGTYLEQLLPGLPGFLSPIHTLVTFAFAILFFAMMFKVLPDADVEWRDVGMAAFATALLFSLGKYLIGLYIGSSNVASAYGAAGALVIVLLWVYYSAQILLFGAEFAKAHSEIRLANRANRAEAQGKPAIDPPEKIAT
jgi:membrane protein